MKKLLAFSTHALGFSTMYHVSTNYDSSIPKQYQYDNSDCRHYIWIGKLTVLQRMSVECKRESSAESSREGGVESVRESPAENECRV